MTLLPAADATACLELRTRGEETLYASACAPAADGKSTLDLARFDACLRSLRPVEEAHLAISPYISLYLAISRYISLYLRREARLRRVHDGGLAEEAVRDARQVEAQYRQALGDLVRGRG